MKKYLIILLALGALHTQVQAQIGNEDSYCAPTGNWVTHPGSEQAIFGNLINDAIGNLATSTTAQTGVNHANGGKVFFYNQTNGAKAIKDGPLALAYGSLTSNYNGGGAAARFYELVTDNTDAAANVPSTTLVNANAGSGAISIEQEVCITKEHFFVNGTNWTPRSKWKHAYIHYDDNATVYSGAGAPNANNILQIDGYASKTGSSSFIFPIGDGIYLRNSALASPTSGQYKTAYFAKNAPTNGTVGISGNNALPDVTANMAAPIKVVNETEFWDIDGTASSNFTLWALNTVAGYSEWNAAINFATLNPQDNVITGFDIWENLGISSLPGAMNVNGPFTTTVPTTPDPLFSAYTWANTKLLFVPITLSNVGASINNCTPTVLWSTATEQSTNRFEVERSTNGVAFTNIATVAAIGNSTTTRNYSYKDVSATKALVYYRLKMIDNNGTFKYSSTVTANNICGNTDGITVYPNPFVSTINVRTNVTVAGKASIRLINSIGQLLITKSVALVAGQNTVTVNVPTSLAKGMYVLEVRNTEGALLGSQKMTRK